MTIAPKDQKYEKTAPYCPTATLLMVLRFYRKQEPPAILPKEKLLQLGVTEGLLDRTWKALMFFGFIEKNGTTREALSAIRFATDEQYPIVLNGILQNAYADIFSVIGDPATATEVRLDNAFTPYSPGGQRDRMKLLFIGLCREAQIPLAVTRTQRSTNADPRASRPRAATAIKSKATAVRGVKGKPQRTTSGDSALVAWFENRPAPGSPWPASSRERWGKTLMAIIEGLYDEADTWTTADDEDGSENRGE